MKRRKQRHGPPLTVVRPIRRNPVGAAGQAGSRHLTVISGNNRGRSSSRTSKSRRLVQLWSWFVLLIVVFGTLASALRLFF